MDDQEEAALRDTLVDLLLSAEESLIPDAEHRRLRRWVEPFPLASVIAMSATLERCHGSRLARVAAATFVFSGTTDEIAFIDVPRNHAASINAVRSIDGYNYPDFFLAPPRVLAEARLLAAMNDLCAADYMEHASAPVTETTDRKMRIVDQNLIRLAQQHLEDGALILSIMNERRTCDAAYIADLLDNTVRPLMEGKL